MGWQIIKQTKKPSGDPVRLLQGDAVVTCEPGKFALWYSVVDDFIAINLTREEVIGLFVREAVERIEREVGAKLDKVEPGEPAYYQFSMSFAEALEERKRVHGA